ncbi:MAG: hypothetical protein EBV06_11300 [Planctomycetia bacterium]|nr:hypothetical protein [Planctomycetia bacterium]
MTSFLFTLWSDLLDRAHAVRDGWAQFWFSPADPLMLGVLRIGTGLVLLWVILATGRMLPTMYGPDAWIDQETARILREQTPYIPPLPTWEPTGPDDRPGIVYQPELNQGPGVDDYSRRWNIWPGYAYSMGQLQFSPYFHLKTSPGLWTTHVLSLIIVVLFTAGVWTRVTSVLAWIVALAYIHRVSSALFGMDTMMALLLLYLMIGPSGDSLSFDRLWTNRQRKIAGLPILDRPEPSEMAGVALRLLQVHFALIYFAAGTSKLQGPSWWNGTAIWQTLANYEFTPERFPGYTAMLRLLAENRWGWELFHTGGTLFTLFLELGFPFLVWYRSWRWFCVLCALALHTGISITMGLHSFSVLMGLIALSFTDPAWLRSWFVKQLPESVVEPATT